MREKKMECWSLSPEMEFMCGLALGKKPLTIPENLNWQKFEALVEDNRIVPLIADGLKQFPQEVLEEYPVLTRLCGLKNQYAILSMMQVQALALIMHAFEQAGIRVISMKGPILAYELYGTPALRYSKDLDLFVSEDEYEQASKILEELGFLEQDSVLTKTPLRRRKFEESIEERHLSYVKGSVQVELHWRYSIYINKTFEELWENRNTKVIMGQEMNCFGDLDNLVYLICHAAGHGFCRLRWLFDIYELQKADTFSWHKIYCAARKSGVGSMIIETMAMLYLMPFFSVRAEVYPLFWIIRRDSFVSIGYENQIRADVKRGLGLVQAVYNKIFETGIRYQYGRCKYDYLMPVAGRNTNFFRFLIRRFQPCETELQLVDLPDSLYFLYYIIRPVYKVWQLLPFAKKESEQ